MKRRGGGRGRNTMASDKKDAEMRMSEKMKMEDLYSKLASLIPQEYRLDPASQGSSDNLMHATTYIKDLRERVEMLKQRRDECRSRVQGSTSGGGSSNAANTAASGSCGPQDTTVQFSGATHFSLKFTMSSRNGVQLHKVIRTVLQDECVEVIDANSSYVDDSKILYVLKCKVYMCDPVSSEAVLDASAVAANLRKLLLESFAEPDRVGV